MNKPVHEVLRAYYLNLPGKTEEGWSEVKLNPHKFNFLWRHYLRSLGYEIEVNNFPPPIDLRGVIGRNAQ